MKKGTDAAREMGNKEHAALIDAFKEQLLIVFLKRLGGKIQIPVTEVDNTSQDMLAFSIQNGIFSFELQRKS